MRTPDSGQRRTTTSSATRAVQACPPPALLDESWRDACRDARRPRGELEKLLDQLRPGDTFVVWRLDRRGRSIRHLIDQLQALADREVAVGVVAIALQALCRFGTSYVAGVRKPPAPPVPDAVAIAAMPLGARRHSVLLVLATRYRARCHARSTYVGYAL